MDVPNYRGSLFEMFKHHFQVVKRLQVPVSVYGKLPIYKDFIRQRLGRPEAQAFKQWIDRGFSKHWESHSSYSGEEIPPHAVLINFPGTGRDLLGYLWGSHDEGHLRSFPFAIFISLPSSRGPSPRLAFLEALDQLVDHAASLRSELRLARDLEGLYRQVRAASVDLSMPSEKGVWNELCQDLREIAVGEFAESLFGSRAGELWPALLARLRAAPSRHAATAALALRIPGSDLVPMRRQVELWSSFRRLWAGATAPSLNLLSSLDSGSSAVTLIERPMRFEDFFALHPAMPQYDEIADLQRGPADGGARPPAPDPELPVAALLDRSLDWAGDDDDGE